MATITIQLNRIEGIRTGFCSVRTIEVECEMTPDQMREAFGEFLKNITDADLAEWIERFELQDRFEAKTGV